MMVRLGSSFVFTIDLFVFWLAGLDVKIEEHLFIVLREEVGDSMRSSTLEVRRTQSILRLPFLVLIQILFLVLA